MRHMKLSRVDVSIRVAQGVLLMTGLLGAGIALADEPDVIVTAERKASPVSETAARATVITAADIETGNYNDVPSILGDVPGIVMRSSSGGPATAEISMRGFGENSGSRVLVLLDGFRINDPELGGMNLLQIAVSSIERIEIVPGGASAMYGDFAVSGVINIITKQGTAAPAGEVSIEGGSFGTIVGSSEAHGAVGGLIYSVNAEAQDSDGYQDQSGYQTLGAGFRLQGKPSDSLSMDYALSAHKLEYDLPSYLTLDQMEADPTQSTSADDHADNEYLTTHFRLTSKVSDHTEQSVGINYKRSDMSTDMNTWGSYFDTVIDTLDLTPAISMKSDVAGMANEIQAGLDLSFDRLDVSRYDSEARAYETVGANVHRDVLGLYLSDELALTEEWRVTGAARVESAKLEGTVDDSTGMTVDDDATHDASAVDASVVRTFKSGSKFYVKGGTLYRYPLVDEQISYVGYGSDQFYTDLKSEKGWSAEVGGRVALSEKINVDLSLFEIDMQDEVAWDYMTYRNQNLDDTRRVGSEVVFNWKPCNAFDSSVGYTFVDAEFTKGENDGQDIPLVPQDKVDVTGRFHFPQGVLAQVRWSHVSEQYLGGDTANVGPKLEDYGVLDLLVRYTPTASPQVDVFAAIDNVLNEEYAALGYKGYSEDAYYPSPGIAYRAGLTYRF